MTDTDPAALDRADRLAPELTAIAPEDVLSVLPRPTLIEIAGERPQPLFLSLMLHGNERAGFAVLQELARRYGERPPPRSLMIFAGNVAATAANRRHLPDQPDFNRVWGDGDSVWHRLVGEVLDIARARNPFASIDIHNTSGDNPHYGSVNALRPADLFLAAQFAPVGVYYRVPSTTQSIAFSALCPAVTIECGKCGDAAGVASALALVEDVMRRDTLPDSPPPPGTLTLYRTIGAVTIDPDWSFAFGGGEADLALREDLESLNFTDLAAGEHWAQLHRRGRPLAVRDAEGHDLTDEMFRVEGETVRLRRSATPAMVTPDPEIAREDCLCYLMERI